MVGSNPASPTDGSRPTPMGAAVSANPSGSMPVLLNTVSMPGQVNEEKSNVAIEVYAGGVTNSQNTNALQIFGSPGGANELALALRPGAPIPAPPNPIPPTVRQKEPPPRTKLPKDFRPVIERDDLLAAKECFPLPPAELDADESEGLRFSQLEEYLAVERGLNRSCRTLPVTLALWLTFVCLVFSHSQARDAYKVSNFIKTSILDATAPGQGQRGRDLHLANILDISEILPWIGEAFLPRVGVDDGQTVYNAHGQIQDTQTLIGFVRLKQERGVGPIECERISSSLSALAEGGCHPPADDNTPATKYGLNVSIYDDAFTPIKDTAGDFEAWLEVGRSGGNVTRWRLESLNKSGWLDFNTQSMAIEAMFLNAEINTYCHTMITLTIHREGYIEHDVQVSPLRGDVHSSWVFIFFDIIWCIILVFLIFTLAGELYEEHSSGTLKDSLKDPYTWLELVNVSVGVGVGLFFWYLMLELGSLADKVADLGDPPEWAVVESPPTRQIQMIDDNDAFQEKLVDIFDHFSKVAAMNMWQRLCTFWYSLVIVSRFLRGFSGQPRTAVLIQTLMHMANFFMHYLIVFIVIFFNFSLGGFILFGEQLKQWSSFGRSISSLFQVMYGQFVYKDMHDVAPITAACWFWSFFVIVVLMLLNFLTAAVLRRYSDIRARLGEPGASLPEQLRELFGEMSWLGKYEGAKKSIPFDTLLTMLSAHTDPVRLRRLGRLQTDRRLRTRTDLTRLADDPRVDVDFLVAEGCDAATAQRLIEKVVKHWAHLSTATSPSQRLLVLVARQMKAARDDAKALREGVDKMTSDNLKRIDRLDLKHAKCLALARRIRKAQLKPEGWTICEEPAPEGAKSKKNRRYLRHDQTGMVSFTLPKLTYGT